MSDSASQPRERVILIDTTANPPPTSAVNDSLTPPQIVLSPKVAGGEPCRGFSVVLVAAPGPDPGGEYGSAAASGVDGEFSITFYRLNTTLGVWAACEPFEGAKYNDQLVCYDLGGGAALYAVIGNVQSPGKMLMLIGELP